MKNNKYYFTIKVPSDFTRNVYSTLGGNKKKADLVYLANDNKNYISGILGSILVNELNTELNKQVIGSFLINLGTNLDNINSLYLGSNGLLTGATNLNNGIGLLNKGTLDFKNANLSINGQFQKLSNGTLSLNDAYHDFDRNINYMTQSLNSLYANLSSLSIAMNSYSEQLNSLIQNSSISDSYKNFLISGYNDIYNNLSNISTGIGNISSGYSVLSHKSSDIYNSIGVINSGMHTLLPYMDNLYSSADILYNSSTKLYAGSSDITSGINAISNGLNTMNSSLASLNLSGNSSTLSNPITRLNSPYSSVKNYGYGFAPYFISLGLFVGALVTTIVLNIKKHRRKNSNIPLKKTFRKISLFAFIVTIQAIILDLILLATKIQLDHPIKLILFSILIAITFMSLIQMLTTIFGDVGRFISIIILILQLTACGGTFPVETSPKFYNLIHSFMPMTYTVDGIRVIIGNGNVNILYNCVIILLMITLVCYGIVIIYFRGSKEYK
jgi:putative membrane protein